MVLARRTEARNRRSCPISRVRTVIVPMGFLKRIGRRRIVRRKRISNEVFLFSTEGGIRTPETGFPV
jgi:hypothetical protein